jgi:hypothetical protein
VLHESRNLPNSPHIQDGFGYRLIFREIRKGIGAGGRTPAFFSPQFFFSDKGRGRKDNLEIENRREVKEIEQL